MANPKTKRDLARGGTGFAATDINGSLGAARRLWRHGALRSLTGSLSATARASNRRRGCAGAEASPEFAIPSFLALTRARPVPYTPPRRLQHGEGRILHPR